MKSLANFEATAMPVLETQHVKGGQIWKVVSDWVLTKTLDAGLDAYSSASSKTCDGVTSNAMGDPG